ncbi:MAG: 3-deoxy-D-manno-octulosonic acid transferase [Planctomycetes bacterium]|nr:3-deoxy-D-manno-octulosonic acid transferase [Planctomycetota bacterium]
MPYLLNTLYAIVLAILFPWLAFRSLMTGRYRRGVASKLFGTTSLTLSSAKPTIWFHGVSVGEVNLLVTVIKAFRSRHPDWQTVVSTTTETGMAEAAKRFADLTVIFWPFDFSWAVKRTLKAVAPKLVVLAESEMWPNFLRAAEKRDIPVMIINGRLSPKSARRYGKLSWLAMPLMFARISKFAMQTESYAAALRGLGVPAERIIVPGSVKYDGVLGERDNPQTRKLAEQLGLEKMDRVWVAGSTHAPEEEIVLDVFARLRVKHPDLRLILVPRSPDRFDEVARLIEKRSLSFARRSKLTAPPKDRPSVILIDTIGDLNAAWGLADIGFTGGSLDGHRGGQSMIEPAGLGVPVVFGPFVWNFRDAVQRLLDVQGAVKIGTPEEMEPALLHLLDNDTLRRQMGEAARLLVLAQQGATERTLDVVDEMLGIERDGQKRRAA